jgi:light-regulated signal transduction histidine kinase (bacteriophytochrome)
LTSEIFFLSTEGADDGASARERRFAGFGLQFVRAHDGRIEVNSEPSHGSTFRVFQQAAGRGEIRLLGYQPERSG